RAIVVEDEELLDQEFPTHLADIAERQFSRMGNDHEFLRCVKKTRARSGREPRHCNDVTFFTATGSARKKSLLPHPQGDSARRRNRLRTYRTGIAGILRELGKVGKKRALGLFGRVD